MPRDIITKVPFKFTFDEYDFNKNIEYIQKYKSTDSKGRYLYWDKFRYRVDEGDDPKIAWWATKLDRKSNAKYIQYTDKDNKPFSFCIPDTLEAKLHKISTLSLQGIVPSNSIKRKYLISSLVMEEAIGSSQLEGASTTRKVAKEMLISQREPKNYDEIMILNNYMLMNEVKRSDTEELTIDMILNFHKIATRGDNNNGNRAGEFRDNNEIVVTDGYETIHQPPCFTKIEERLQKICKFANSEHTGEDDTVFINPIIKATILHFMIGYEHPFSEGNGRTARAIFYWYMHRSGFEYFEYISISKLLKNAPAQYGKSYLYSGIDDNDLTYFVYYQIEIITRAIGELLEYLQNKSQEFEEVLGLLSKSSIGDSLNFIQKDILKEAIKNPGRIFTSKEVMTNYDKTANTARKYLNELVEYKILAIIKNGNTKEYIALANIRDILER